MLPSFGEAVDIDVSLLTRVISLSRGDIGVGGARLLFKEDPAVNDGGSRTLWKFCSMNDSGKLPKLIGERCADSTPVL
jgi:hypothetical protein